MLNAPSGKIFQTFLLENHYHPLNISLPFNFNTVTKDLSMRGILKIYLQECNKMKGIGN